MTESGYYPTGAEFDSSAPWNEPEIPEIGIKVTISQSFSKTVTVRTNDYDPVLYCDIGTACIDIANTNWNELYNEQHFDIKELLKELKSCLIKDLGKKDSLRTKQLLEACDGWIEDEFEVIPD